MTGIYHQLAILAPIERVYRALSSAQGVSRWWAAQTESETEEGLFLEHDPGARHGIVRLKVLDRVPNARVEWECVSQHPADSPASAWTGTHFIFELSEGNSPAALIESGGADGKPVTTLDFRHTRYDSDSPYYGFNNFAWASVLGNLKRICEAH